MRHAAQLKRGKNRTKWPGICAAAVELGVDRSHLLAVLSQRRKSRILTVRYRQLKGLPLSRPQALLISEFHRRQAEKAVTAQRTNAPILTHP